MANKNSRVLATGSNQITHTTQCGARRVRPLSKRRTKLDAITAHSDGTVVWCQSGIPNDQAAAATVPTATP